MAPWIALLALEACAVVLLLALARRVGRDAAETTSGWRRATEGLRPALVALRSDAERARSALDALERRGRTEPRQ